MPPVFDVYVWVGPDGCPATLARFVDEYVDSTNPGDPRFAAFVRSYITENPIPGDAEALAELRREADAGSAFSLYLRAKGFHEAIVTLTDEGALVLGLGIDDPLNDPSVWEGASGVITRLMAQFGGSAAIGGAELAPPQSATEWSEDALVVLRVGNN